MTTQELDTSLIGEGGLGAAADEARLYTKVAWRLTPFLILIFLFGNMDRANVGFAALSMRQDLGLSNAAYGFGAGIFFLGYFLFEIPSNIALQKVGAKIWFARIVFTWGLATCALAFVKGPTSFYILRFAIGAAEAGIAPGVMLYLSNWVPDSQRGRFNALYWLAAPIAFVITGPLSGFVMTYFNGLAGVSGWQWMFIVEGGLTMLMGPILLFGLTNSIDSAKWLSPGEKQTAHRGLVRLNQTAHAHSYRDAVFNAKTIFACLAYFSLLVGYYGIAFWQPQLIKHAGVSDTMTIGLLSALPWLAAGVTVVFIGPYSDSPGRRGAVRTGAMLLTAAGFFVSAYFASSVALALLGLTMAAVGILAASTVFWADLARIYVGPAAAIGFAVINSIGNLGGFFSPYMLGFVTDLTGSAVMGMYAIVASILISCGLMFVAFRSLRN